jgi:uncharacterized membrane protein
MTNQAQLRLRSVDIIRGIACLLMAIDNVRVYSGLPAGGLTPGLFFTRWITHFVAPAFCFFAGTSAFFHGRKLGDTGKLAQFLVTRGVVLVLLELTIIRVAWTFNFAFNEYILFGVIWMLGVCMILLAGLVRLSPRAIGLFGIVVIFAQQLIALLSTVIPKASQPHVRWIFQFLWTGGRITAGGGPPTLAILYSIVPWVGVMAAGYAFAALILTRDADARRRACLRIGLSATALFVIIATVVELKRPPTPEDWPILLRILGQQKYPATQLFLMMTLGPIIALIPVAERAHGWMSSVFAMFGRVPMFFYLIHIPIIHAAAMVVSLVRERQVDPWLFGNHPMMPPPQPPGYMWSLGLLYLVYILVLPILYFACRWYAGLKRTSSSGMLKYI